ncbi:MAG: hypothetical protein ACXV3C_10700 [Actinomycetes bacterium]
MHSAEFWSQKLGGYSAQMARRANTFAYVAAALSAVTGAAIWTTLSDSTEIWAQIVVTAMAVVAAIVALIPKQAGYGDCATQAAKLSGDYGGALIALSAALDHLDEGRAGAEDEAQKALAAFKTIRDAKEALRPYPDELERGVQAERASKNIPEWLAPGLPPGRVHELMNEGGPAAA